MSNKIKIEPSLTNRKSISVAKKMGKKYTLADAIMVGKKLGINWNKVDFKPSDLLVGMHYELEHGKIDARTNVTGDSRIKTAKVAWAHLVERPDYYVQLMKIDPPESPEEKKKHIEEDIKKTQEKKAMELNLRLSKQASYLRDIKCEVCGYQGKPNGKGQCPTCFAIMGKKGRELPIPPKDIQPVSNGRSVEEDAMINAYEENLTAY